MERTFSIKETLKSAFGQGVDNFKIFLSSLIIILVLHLLVFALIVVIAIKSGVTLQGIHDTLKTIDIVKGSYAEKLKLLLYLMVPIYLFRMLFGPLWLGFTKIALQVHDKKSASLMLLFSCYGRIFVNYIGAYTLYYAIIFVFPLPIFFLGTYALVRYGFVVLWLFWIAYLFFIVYLAERFSFFTYCMVDTNADIRDSLRMSSRITKGNVWNIFFLRFLIMTGMSYLAGGTTQSRLAFIGWPFMTMANVIVYRKLSGATPSA